MVLTSVTMRFMNFLCLKQWFPNFLVPGTGFIENNFSTEGGWKRWFGDDSSALYLFLTLFLI